MQKIEDLEYKRESLYEELSKTGGLQTRDNFSKLSQMWKSELLLFKGRTSRTWASVSVEYNHQREELCKKPEIRVPSCRNTEKRLPDATIFKNV